MEDNPHKKIKLHLCAPYREDLMILHSASSEFVAARSDPETACEISSDLDFDHHSVLVCTQEGLSENLISRLQATVASQPSWSQMPVLLILDQLLEERDILEVIGSFAGDLRLTVLHRPVRPLEFKTALTAVMDARVRQLEIKSYIDQKQELNNELNHRIKNTLASVIALFNVSLRQSTDLSDFQQRFSDRLTALNSIQDLLRDSDNATRSIKDIALAVFAPYQTSTSERISIVGGAGTLSRQPAQSVALMFNELATNASKYGALSVPNGKVQITVECDAEFTNIIWREVNGPPVTPPSRTSYGTRFIDATCKGLRGEAKFDYAQTGLVCEMSLNNAVIDT